MFISKLPGILLLRELLRIPIMLVSKSHYKLCVAGSLVDEIVKVLKITGIASILLMSITLQMLHIHAHKHTTVHDMHYRASNLRV